MFALELDGVDFSIPWHRRRLWMPHAPNEALDDVGLTPQSFHEGVKDFTCLFAGHHSLTLDDVLCDESDASVTGKLHFLEARELASQGRVVEASIVYGSTPTISQYCLLLA